MVNRRRFLQMAGIGSGVLAGGLGLPRLARAAQAGEAATTVGADGLLAGRTVDALIERYRYDLFDDFLAFLEQHIIDHESGGFMCNADRRGNLLNTNKSARFEGRGIWIYSTLYRTLAPEDKYLEVARKSVQFVLKSEPKGDGLWPNSFTREGEALPDEGMFIAGKRYTSTGEVYDDLFIANGFAAYSRASGEQEFRDRAINILLKCERLYDRDDYAPTAPLVYMDGEAPLLPGLRQLGVWMVMIDLCRELLEAGHHDEVKRISDRCIDAIMVRHFNEEFRLLNEVLNHDFSLPDNVYAQLAYTGHGIETLWMVLYEAVRRGDRQLFEQAAERFHRHLAVSWDDVYDGWFRGCRNVEQNVWILDKALWVQEEALIGLLSIIEHTGAQWAKEWFDRGYNYVIEKFPLKKHGYSLWDLYPDRKVTFVEQFGRVGNFHHPRHLILNLLALQRIRDRDGRISGVFA